MFMFTRVDIYVTQIQKIYIKIIKILRTMIKYDKFQNCSPCRKYDKIQNHELLDVYLYILHMLYVCVCVFVFNVLDMCV
jgi:hypothetical protein